MSNANKLREDLINLVKYTTDQTTPNNFVNAILQAIEDELPEQREWDENDADSITANAARGYNSAIHQVKSLLASARSGGTEE